MTLTLSNEEIFAGGCVEQIGLVQQMEISNSPRFENAERMAWQRRIR